MGVGVVSCTEDLDLKVEVATEEEDSLKER